MEARTCLKAAIALLLWQISARSFGQAKQKEVLVILAGLDKITWPEKLKLQMPGTRNKSKVVVKEGRFDSAWASAEYWPALLACCEKIEEHLQHSCES